MANRFKRLMREQIQASVMDFFDLTKKPAPKNGWIKTIREALGLSSKVLANKLGCSQANISYMEAREKKKSISLESLEQVAQAMNCKLVYCLVPLEPFDKILEKQARKVAKKQISLVNHSMKLEQQGLNAKQLKQEEDDLVEELLSGNPKKLWTIDEI